MGEDATSLASSGPPATLEAFRFPVLSASGARELGLRRSRFLILAALEKSERWGRVLTLRTGSRIPKPLCEARISWEILVKIQISGPLSDTLMHYISHELKNSHFNKLSWAYDSGLGLAGDSGLGLPF